jgi:hypothetical protein
MTPSSTAALGMPYTRREALSRARAALALRDQGKASRTILPHARRADPDGGGAEAWRGRDQLYAR